MDNIVGLIVPVKERSDPDIGFAYNIDMAYKGKPDQETDFFYKYHGHKNDFIKLCEKLKIEIREFLKCDFCGDAIFGSFTMIGNKKQCYKCELSIKKRKS